MERVRNKNENDIVVRAKINGYVGNVLFDTGAQISLISEKFVNKHKHQFKETQILPVSNTIVTTATGESQTICNQVLVTIWSQGMEVEIPVLIVKNLIYDVVLGLSLIHI